MKAWLLEKQSKIEERPLKLTDVPLALPNNQEIRVKVQVCGICGRIFMSLKEIFF